MKDHFRLSLWNSSFDFNRNNIFESFPRFFSEIRSLADMIDFEFRLDENEYIFRLLEYDTQTVSTNWRKGHIAPRQFRFIGGTEDNEK